MFYYHTFKDLNIQGIYDHEPLLQYYHFPNDELLKGKKVLDVGCASGFFSKYFAERGANVVAIDINTSVTNMVKNRTKLEMDIVEADVFSIDSIDTFDIVFCGSLLMHVIYPMELLKIINKALKPNGLFILCSGGIDSIDPVIRTERYLGRQKSAIEKDVNSANESLWWLSKSAGEIMLKNVGFDNVKYMDSFTLTSTEFGVKIGHNFSALHHVWHSTK